MGGNLSEFESKSHREVAIDISTESFPSSFPFPGVLLSTFGERYLYCGPL